MQTQRARGAIRHELAHVVFAPVSRDLHCSVQRHIPPSLPEEPHGSLLHLFSLGGAHHEVIL